MNFLLGGGSDDGDGWDDDDDLGDLSDQSLDNDEEEEEPAVQMTNAHQPPPPPPQAAAAGSGLAMGGGMFMGRLTRFLDAVTQPEDDEEEEEGSGWDDDLGLDDDADEGEEQAGGNGWGDDDELEFDDSPVKASQPPPPPPQNVPTLQPEPAMDPTQSQLMDSGWDDELDLTGVDDPEPPQPPPTPPPVATASPSRKPDAIVPLNDVNSRPLVDHTPPRYNRNVSFDASLAVVGSVQTLDDNLGTSAAEAETPSTGWDDNDDGLEDLDVDDDPQPPPGAAAVDHTPRPPPPPPPRQISNITASTSTAEVGTNVAVAPSTQSSGWDDDDDGLFDDIEIDGGNDAGQAEATKPVKMLDHTPPPPPPPAPREASLTVSFGGTSDPGERMSALTNAWDADEAAMNGIDDTEGEATQLVDVTPPPPPPPRDDRSGAAGASAVAVAATDDGWGDDDEILGDVMSADGAEPVGPDESTPVVDHTPPPPPPQMHRFGTNAATLGDDDDIYSDDTLSVDNSKSHLAHTSISMALSDEGSKEAQPVMVDRTPPLSSPIPFRRSETAEAVRTELSLGSSTLDDHRQSTAGDSSEGNTPQPTNVVDHTPSVTANGDTQSAVDQSLAVLGGTVSSVGESLDSLDNSRDPRNGEPRPKGKMVDHTPPVRFNRHVDASLVVSGHTSVGESLDSINEADEYSESTPTGPLSTPLAVESGWGAALREYNRVTQDSTEIPFGSAVTPTAAGSGASKSIEENGEKEVPLVDHTPTPVANHRSQAGTVDALSVSSEDGDLGASDDEVDGIKDNLYGQVVDHTPETPGKTTPSDGEEAKDAPASEPKQEDDTVRGVAERQDVEFDRKQDEGMDDESSKGTQGTSVIGTLDDIEVRSLLGGSRGLAVLEEKQLVDHVPETKGQRPADASTMVLADESSASSRVDDNVTNDNETARGGFGPIVDHTPGLMNRSVSGRSIATSVLTQNSGLMTDLKMDEEMEVATATGGGDESGGDRQQSKSADPEEKHLVDRVPKRRHYPRNPLDWSIRVHVDNTDDMTQVDTIAEDTVVDFGPVVDQTPFSARSAALSGAASMATQGSVGGVDGDTKPDDDMDTVTAPGASLDGGSGWDHDEPDLEDMSATNGPSDAFPGEESNLVDHVPRRSFVRPADASTAVMIDPMDAASQADDNDANAANGRFGPVVDHTPRTPITGHASVAQSMLTQVSGVATDIQNDDMDGTWFGASTVGGISTLGGVSTVGASSAAEGSSGEESSSNEASGWNEDMDGFDDLPSPTTAKRPLHKPENHLVDHVPSITSPRPTDASTAVAVDASVVSSQRHEDANDQNIDEGTFGAVVDHTPSISRISQYSVANSMATNLTGLAADIKQDEDMDENTSWNGEGSNQEDGWDQDEPELEEIADAAADDDEMPPLVDHVPERPDSRPTDASTIVAADPSEMNSQVDDFGQDEENFGPVVDQTPRSQFSINPSATTGSTIVASPSIVDDDLDEAVDAAINGEETVQQNQNEWEEVPNPQSGNEEASDGGQLVDYLPPDDDSMPELVRDGSSEMATVGEKSVLPTDDPKEDEFGLIVDQTPFPDASVSSSAGPRAGRREDGSKKSSGLSSSGHQNVDSVAPQFSVASSEDENDGLEEDEFGPVVDQLPVIASKSAFSASRGGSTVDALATVSEVDDDLNDGDGWEDDTEIDVGEQSSPSATTRPGEDRNLSVKWIDRLSEKDSAALLQKNANVSKQSASTTETSFYDAVMGDTSRLSLNETRYYDPELADSSTWDDGLDALNGLDDEDDTPPSTPRQSLDFKRSEAAPKETNEKDCPACANATSSECPCVQGLIDANRGSGNMVGRLKTKEGEMVEVDFEKLLETEITRRRLIETESEALRSTIESLKASKVSLVEAGETQMSALNKLHGSNNELSDNLNRLKQECEKLRMDNERVQAENRKLVNDVNTLGSEQQRSRDTEGELKSQVAGLESQLSQAAAAASAELTRREDDLKAQVIAAKKSSDDQSRQRMQLDTECENLRGKNESLYEDLEAYRQSVSKLEEKNASLSATETALNAEVHHLKAALENQIVTSSSTSQLEEQLRSIQSNHASKAAECEELKSQIAQLQQRLTASEAENFKHTKDMARTSREHSQAISNLQQRVQQTQTELDGANREKEAFVKDYTEKLSIESAAVNQLRAEKDSAEKDRQAAAESHAKASREHQHQLTYAQKELQLANGRITTLQNEKVQLSSQVEKLVDQLKTAESQTLEFLSVSRERNVLQEALVESKETISSLQKKVNVSTELETQVESLRQQLQEARTSAESEHSAIVARCQELEQRCEYAQTELDSSTQKTAFVESELSNTLEQLRSVSSANAELVMERGRLQNEVKALTEASQRAHEEARLHSENSSANKMNASELQAETDRLKLELERVSGVHTDQVSQLQALENELAEAGSLMANKDQIIVILKEQQRSSRSQFQELQAENKAHVSKAQELGVTIVGLEKENERLFRSSEQHDASLQKFNEEITRLAEERDNVAGERDALEEDNEEMLVQFGLLKEQMDGYEAQFERMQDELLSRESTVRDLETKLAEAQSSIDELAASMGDKDASTALFESTREKWAEERNDLENRLAKLESEKSEIERAMYDAESNNRTLSELAQDLQTKLDELVSASQAKESQLISVIDSMEEQCSEFRDKCHVLERELDLRNRDLEQAHELGQDRNFLQEQVDQLEQTLSENKRLLHQKDGALQDLQFQLQHAGNAPKASAELDTLRRTVQELEDSVANDRQRMRELETQLTTKQQELDSTMRELSSAQILAEQLQTDVDVRKQKEVMTRGLEDNLRKSESSLDDAQKELSRLRQESGALRSTISALESELREKQASHQSSKEASSQKSAEIESLRQEISALRTQQAQSSRQVDTREKMIEKEVHELQRQMQTKDSQLQKLERELHMLGTDLSQSHVDLASKQEHVDKLTSELEDFKQQANQPATTRVLDLTQDEAESVDKMRSHIISLAKALEQSECRRAEAIERLEKERKANADSLRRLTESVKRFYSTLSCGDS